MRAKWTDLAVEAAGGKLREGGLSRTVVKVEDEASARRLGRPMGTYVTLACEQALTVSLETRRALAAELACGKLTQEDFFELECALRDAKAAGEKDDAAAVMACDERFHEMIVQAAGNAYVTEFSGTLMLHIRRIKYHYFHLPAMRQASASQHADILAALRAHDAALAKQRMREHWLRAMRGCLNETIAYLEQNEA